MIGEGVVVVRYGEIGLKKGNRRLFERALQERVHQALARHPHRKVVRPHGRILVRGPADPRRAALRAARVFGVTSTSPAVAVEPDVDRMAEAGRRLVGDRLERIGLADGGGRTFRVQARRADKRFPLPSVEVARRVADAVLAERRGLRVDLGGAEITLGVEVRADEALVWVERFAGPGGLPVGTLGRAVVLFSGGIDSPVAAWFAMKRGLEIELLHFHAPEFVGEGSRAKAIDLARALARWHPRLTLRVVPFGAVQVAVRKGAPPSYRTILYRRSMNRIAARAAERFEARALVTGESLGQVASQTLENLACIEDSADRLVLRPLVGLDKHEIVERAREIGTYEVSIRPAPDCCTLFQPEHPKVRADVDRVRAVEERIDLASLESEAWERHEEVVVEEAEPQGG